MGRYFWMQCKRLFRYFPGALLAAVLLLGGLLAAITLLTEKAQNSDEQTPFKIAISGYTDDSFLQMGLSAIESFDSTRFSLEILQMDEAAASRALKKGEIAAYAVIPQDFVDSAFRGEVIPIKFVSTAGATGLVSIFKEEVTDVISDLLVYSQKGVIGMMDAHYENDLGSELHNHPDVMSFYYVDYVLARDRIYTLETLGFGDQPSLGEYLLCGLTVLFLLLCCLPFAPVMVHSDDSLAKMLNARGRPALQQSMLDFCAYCLGLFLLALGAVLLAGLFAPAQIPLRRLVSGWPVILLVSAITFMLYCLCRELISAVLLQFFAGISLCFASGCLYPVYFFPVSLQKLGNLLPTGAARSLLSGSLSGTRNPGATALVFGYSLVFVAVGAALRRHRIKGVQG